MKSVGLMVRSKTNQWSLPWHHGLPPFAKKAPLPEKPDLFQSFGYQFSKVHESKASSEKEVFLGSGADLSVSVFAL